MTLTLFYRTFFQHKEVKLQNQKAILVALKHPSVDIKKLLEETKEKYKSEFFTIAETETP